MIKRTALLLASVLLLFTSTELLAGGNEAAGKYLVDTKGMHAFVQFKVKHLGFSWLYGRFTKFDGEFTYDPADDSKNTISMSVDLASLETDHAERNKHLRSDDFLMAEKYKTAKFVSSAYQSLGEGKAKLTGTLSFMGKSQEITFDVDVLGAGADPWGGYRQGFEARATLAAGDWGIKKADMVGNVELTISVEGIKQ